MKRIIAIAAISLIFLGVSAQTTENLLLLSQNNFGISTARSAAMGGAFTSLGADAASMSINPAGLGMYKRGEVSITPQLRFGMDNTSYMSDRGLTNNHNSRDNSKFVVSNIGVVYIIDEVVFGFGYNRLADFYSRSQSRGDAQSMSITDMFAAQLNGISSNNLQRPTNNEYEAFRTYPPVSWGGILGYQTYAVGALPNDKYASMLESGAYVAPNMSVLTKGALDEITFSMGFNFEDKFYFGGTMGLQSFNYSKTDLYYEFAEETTSPTLSEFGFGKELHMTGTGLNFKFGAIARPVDWFRIGVSYHTPTWMTIDESSSMWAYSQFFDEPGKYYDADSRIFISAYDARTAARLLVGASVTIANKAILSFDYKRTWDNQMKYRTGFKEYGYRPEYTATGIDNFDAIARHMNSAGDIDINGIISDSYCPTNNYSVGLEINTSKNVFVRGGYMYQDSPYADSDLKKYGELEQLSAGIGYRNRDISVDLTYVNSRTKLLPMKYFAYEHIISDGMINTDRTIDNIMLTIGFRF